MPLRPSPSDSLGQSKNNILLVLLNPSITMTTSISTLPLLASLFALPKYLLLQHNAVHARLEQRVHQTGLALQPAQRVEDLGGRRFGEGGEERG